jgi:hypothetical protein
MLCHVNSGDFRLVQVRFCYVMFNLVVMLVQVMSGYVTLFQLRPCYFRLVLVRSS